MTGLQAHLDQSKYKRVCRIERWTRFLYNENHAIVAWLKKG